ncbi:hypothetical protein SLA2020_467030 [Shorea laevis]
MAKGPIKTRVIFLLILFCGSAVGSRTSCFSFIQDDISNDGVCKSMVEPQGYACEEHTVTTQDGYILSLQRIPLGRSGGTAGNRPPVLLQHGLISDGVIWLLLPPESSLAFSLADNGYEVWIANSRGTKYSSGHTSLTLNDSWDWTWDELVSYDLSATVQYVHSQTGQKLHYAGHSLGTLMVLSALSKNQLVTMLRSAALLSPIAYLGQITTALAKIAADTYIAEEVRGLGINEFDTGDKVINGFLTQICQNPGVDCTNMWTASTGQNCCLNSSIINVYLDHEPQPTSTKNMIHLAQMIRTGTINMYDYNNKEENVKHYGQPTPPAYDMTNIPQDFPLFLSYGGADALADVQDVKRLLSILKDHQGDKLVLNYRDNYAHLDFVMSENAKEAVYDSIIAFFKLQ